MASYTQFLHTGNDHAARETCPCIWIVNPRETGKVLQHVMRHFGVEPIELSTLSLADIPQSPAINIYTGENK